MKTVLIALAALFLLLQYEVWFAHGGLLSAWRLKKSINKQTQVNASLEQRENVLRADIKDLKTGHHAVEERARNELGMVKNDEVFYQVINLRQRKKP